MSIVTVKDESSLIMCHLSPEASLESSSMKRAEGRQMTVIHSSAETPRCSVCFTRRENTTKRPLGSRVTALRLKMEWVHISNL